MLTIRKEQMDALAKKLGRLIQQCEETSSAGKVRHTDPSKADELIRKHLKDCAKKGIDAGKKIQGSASIVGEPEWSKAGVAHYGDDTWKTKKVDNLNGFVDKHGKVWVHRDRGNPATMIHEGIHKYSDQTLVKQSQPLNESMTEYFTRLVAGKEKMAKGRRNYQENYESAKALADLVGNKALCDAYFGGNIGPLKAAVDKKQEAGTWEKYIAATKDNKWSKATALLAPKK